MHPFRLAAQISTSHSADNLLSVASVHQVLKDAQNVISFPIYIVGARELPEIFMEMTKSGDLEKPDTYIWYNLLSDYPGQTLNDSIVNYQGKRCSDWQGWNEAGESEVQENFNFSCPNNPEARRKTLAGLTDILARYPFDGVFLDKLRYPSPANGLETAMSCFCPYCMEKALAQGLDLQKVKKQLDNWLPSDKKELESDINWLDVLVEKKPLLQQFIRFRCESITELVNEVRQMTNSMNRRLALDLFTPSLATLVGQDYRALSSLADWAKPMIYRYAYGPAGIRLEVQKLVEDIQNKYHLSIESLLDWLSHYYPEVSIQSYSQMVENAAPLEWIKFEIHQAVKDFQPKPILMGLETVSFPGVIDITPSMVEEMVKTAVDCRASGVVTSWDLMHTPVENIVALRNSLLLSNSDE